MQLLLDFKRLTAIHFPVAIHFPNLRLFTIYTEGARGCEDFPRLQQ
jgi:hypothetical protein